MRSFSNFTARVYADDDAEHLAEDVRSLPRESGSSPSGRCPETDPQLDLPPLGHFCWSNGTYIRKSEPTRSTWDLLVMSLWTVLAGMSIGLLPFLVSLAVVVCMVPCRSELT
mmetsp:Transcript_6189/g.14097  ORF Transcript_6189/g.14097 Transcript_6189/m.14097 type:complete len:112 (-) Transcript_6189:37-372(-)